MAENEQGDADATEVLLLVCLKCGRESTERETDTDDTAEDMTRQDLLDLNNP